MAEDCKYFFNDPDHEFLENVFKAYLEKRSTIRALRKKDN
jgi:hypothetical protein